MRLKNKVALITGAQKGIGAAIVRTFAREGASVVINWLDDRVGAERLSAEVKDAGGTAVAVQGSVASADDVTRLFDAAGALGGIDVLVNNAGIFPRVPLLEMSENDWDQVMAVNLKGAWRCLQAAARSMVAGRRSGTILNMSSVAFWSGSNRGVHYAASKGGLIGLTRSAAHDLARYGIRVNAIAPGITDTDQPRDGLSESEISAAGANLPLGRIARPEDIANAALFLCCEESAHVTGQTLSVNGGQMFL